jgi:hypothetical protein
MKAWNRREMQPAKPDDSWLKSLARRLRDWLNRVLQEAESPASGAHGEASPSFSGSSDPGARDEGSEPISGTGEQAAPSSQNLFGPAGPPEEWLRLVREGAPELLLPVEEGGTPWQGLRGEATQSEPKEEWAGIPADDLASSIPRSQEAEKPADIAGLPSASANSSSKSMWERLRQRLTGEVLRRKVESAISRQHLAESENKPTVRIPARPELASQVSSNDFQPQRVDADSELLGPANRNKVTSESNPVRGVEQNIEKLQRLAPASDHSLQIHVSANQSQAEASVKAVKTTSPPSHGAERNPQPAHLRAATDEASSRTLVTVPRLEQVSTRIEGRREREGDVHTSTKDSMAWTPWPTVPSEPATRTSKKAAGTEQSTSGDRLALDQKFAEPLPVSSARRPDVAGDDRWPELPETHPAATADWRQFLRRLEHLRALDLEQRGDS